MTGAGFLAPTGPTPGGDGGAALRLAPWRQPDSRCPSRASTKAAVAHGITGSVGVVTSAATVMVPVFAIFATLSPLDFKQLGVGLAAAILIDATIVRAVRLSSAMELLGERNWWIPASIAARASCGVSRRGSKHFRA
jgi:uncharacterized membrane protein YdfJ with MMPL/SSD domain